MREAAEGVLIVIERRGEPVAELRPLTTWAFAEFHAVLQRRIREGAATARDARDLASRFSEHVEDGLWNLIPVTEALQRRTAALIASAPSDLFIRTADAVHLTTAQEARQREVWTNDRHMLAAAGYFGLKGCSV